MSQLNLSTEDLGPTVAGRKRLQKGATTNKSAQWMEEERKNIQTYEYLCHVGEAKEWIEACITEDIGEITKLDDLLRNGVILAKLAKFFEPSVVKKIFEDPKLQFRHSDNLNFFFAACKKAGLPDLFIFELTDVYDKKNIPKAIYCIHALSHFLAKKGIAPKIKNLVGQLNFTDEELLHTEKNLADAGVQLPQFGNVEGALAKELNEETEEEKREKFLKEHEQNIIKAQAYVRSHLASKRYKDRLALFKSSEDFIVRLQAHIRGYFSRRKFQERKDFYKSNEKFIVKIQATTRGYLHKKHYDDLKAKIEKQIPIFTSFQACARGYLARRAFKLNVGHYKNEDSIKRIVKIQSFVKGKLLNKAYKSLAHLDTIPVKTVQQFIHLLDDSDQDFKEELDLESLKQLVVKKIRDNNQTEQLLNELDIKIALLVRNRITLDEVLKTSTKQKKAQLSGSPHGSTNNLYSHEDMFTSSNFKSLDKDSRNRLELYQNLFYILQTRPKYLAKIIFSVKQTKIRAFMDHVLLPLFNYANSAREEFLLLKLFQDAVKEEMNTTNEIAEFLRGNPVFIKMVVHYYRGAKERQFLRELLQPLVKDVIGNDGLDLETDPLVIYRQVIRDEESRTGEASSKPFDISREDALKDPEANKLFNEHLEQLKANTDKFLDAIIKSLSKMPYGIRYIASQLQKELTAKFPPENKEDSDRIVRVIGNLVYYRYMNPAIVAPEGFDVIEQLISPVQRKNLAEISKILQQISVNRAFENEYAYLAPLNQYVAKASERMSEFFQQVVKVPDAEEYFQMTDFSDLVKTTKPVIYITPQEIFSTHQLLLDTLDTVSVKDKNKDPLHLLLKEMGTIPSSVSTVDYSGAGSSKKDEDDKAPTATGDNRGNEISLTLSSRFIENATASSLAGGGEAAVQYKNLFLETKRFVLSLIRVQSGKNILDLLEKPVSGKEEHLYDDYLKLESAHQEKRAKEQKETPLPDSLPNLKEAIKVNLVKLDSLYAGFTSLDEESKQHLGLIKINKENNYQEILSSIGLDIRNKHRRRIQRRAELKQLNNTIKNLDEKMKYLDDQKQSYHDYINSCMAQLTSNRKKQGGSSGGKFVMPFSPQWNHMQDLKKQGKVPQFGSYKYGADVLYKKGVLVSVDGYTPKQFDKISLTISSDETGVFTIEVSIMGIKMPQKMEVKLEDLLQYQFDNQQIIPLFDGAAKVNVNLLIFLINKKFYN